MESIGAKSYFSMVMATGQPVLFRKDKVIDIFTILTLCLVYLPFSNAVEVSRPRGVSLSRKSLYDPGRDFTCLDGSVTVPFQYVNDDYCDCNDGSDEPGTAACPNGFFHCTNAGHKPLNIPSSRVNDGICDCCDASDEYNSSANCGNYCKELGRQAREAAQAQMEVITKGYEIKQNLIKEGKKLKDERQNKLKELEKESIDLNTIKEVKEAIKKTKEEIEKEAIDQFNKDEEERKLLIQQEQEQKDAEENERLSMAAFMDLDVDQNGKLTLDEIKSKWVFDTDKDGIVTDEEAKHYLVDKEEIDMEEFKAESWPLIKPQYSLSQMFTPPGEQQEQTAEIHPDPVVDEEIYREQVKSSETEEEEEFEEEEEEDENKPKIPPQLLKEMNIESEADLKPPTEPEKPVYDEETQALIDDAENARTEFKEAERKARDADTEMEKAKKVSAIDFGPDDEFSSLHSECLDFNDHEYTYTLCFFDRTTQKPKDGSPINLGSWGKWEVDGNEENRYSKMKYEHGLSCWNGPARSTEVRLFCGATNQLIKVSEPEKCKYLMDVTTPAACTQPSKQADSLAHEEL